MDVSSQRDKKILLYTFNSPTDPLGLQDAIKKNRFTFSLPTAHVCDMCYSQRDGSMLWPIGAPRKPNEATFTSEGAQTKGCFSGRIIQNVVAYT